MAFLFFIYLSSSHLISLLCFAARMTAHHHQSLLLQSVHISLSSIFKKYKKSRRTRLQHWRCWAAVHLPEDPRDWHERPKGGPGTHLKIRRKVSKVKKIYWGWGKNFNFFKLVKGALKSNFECRNTGISTTADSKLKESQTSSFFWRSSQNGQTRNGL